MIIDTKEKNLGFAGLAITAYTEKINPMI